MFSHLRNVLGYPFEIQKQRDEVRKEIVTSDDDVEEREEKGGGGEEADCRCWEVYWGETAELAILLEKSSAYLFSSSSSSLSAPPSSEYQEPGDLGIENVEEHDLARSDKVGIQILLTATEMYRQIFPISLSSSPSAASVILSSPPPRHRF